MRYLIPLLLILSACAPDPLGPYGNDLQYVTDYGSNVYASRHAVLPPIANINAIQDLYRQRIFGNKVDTHELFNGLDIVFLHTLADVQVKCGKGAAACYWPGAAAMVIPTEALCTPAIAHEFTHHALQRTAGWSDHDHKFGEPLFNNASRYMVGQWDCHGGNQSGALTIEPLPDFSGCIIHGEE